MTATARSVSGILRAAGFSASVATSGDLLMVALDWTGGRGEIAAARELLEGRGVKVLWVSPSKGWLFLERRAR